MSALNNLLVSYYKTRTEEELKKELKYLRRKRRYHLANELRKLRIEQELERRKNE